jgi:hypothetical protein
MERAVRLRFLTEFPKKITGNSNLDNREELR